MYCQLPMWGWPFLLLLTPCLLLEEGLGVPTYNLSKSDTNDQLNASLPLHVCSNRPNDYCHWICGIFDVGITVHYHCHCHYNHSSAGHPSPSYCNYCPQIDGTVGRFHWSVSHGHWCRSFHHCGCYYCHPGTCHGSVHHCGHCCQEKF